VKTLADQDANGLHALRKDIKKLRYLAGMFGSLWPRKRVRPYVRALGAMQDLLGAVNDTVVVGQLLSEWRNYELTHADFETIGLVRGWLLARMREHLRQFPQMWADFDDAGRFWRRKAKT
jgi:CHAD domain-containing protein